MEDFYNRAKKGNRRVTKKVVESLVFAGAFDNFSLGEEYDEFIGTPTHRNLIFHEFFAQRKKKEEVELLTDEEFQDKEIEVLGLCLSRPPLRDLFRPLVKERKWIDIGRQEHYGSALIFGKVEKILDKVTKKGDPMLVVQFTDEIDSIEFLVFNKSIPFFYQKLYKGAIAAVPMKKFSDTNTRFYDSSRGNEVEIFKRSDYEDRNW